jgi:hypothetical protein
MSLSNYEIPKILHLIWFGDLPTDLDYKINLWKKWNRDFTIWLWTSENFVENFNSIKYNFLEIKLIEESLEKNEIIKLWLEQSIDTWGKMIYGAASDVARLSIITQYGGHYTDLDNYPGKINDDWGTKHGYYILKNNHGHLLPALIGGVEKNAFTKNAEDLIINGNYNLVLTDLNNADKIEKWSFIADIITRVFSTTLKKLPDYNPEFLISRDFNCYTVLLGLTSEKSDIKDRIIEIGSGLSAENSEYVKTDYINTLFYKEY